MGAQIVVKELSPYMWTWMYCFCNPWYSVVGHSM